MHPHSEEERAVWEYERTYSNMAAAYGHAHAQAQTGANVNMDMDMGIGMDIMALPKMKEVDVANPRPIRPCPDTKFRGPYQLCTYGTAPYYCEILSEYRTSPRTVS
jgi:hypothetical protein